MTLKYFDFHPFIMRWRGRFFSYFYYPIPIVGLVQALEQGFHSFLRLNKPGVQVSLCGHLHEANAD